MTQIFINQENSKVEFDIQERKDLFFHESNSLRAPAWNIFNPYINDLDKSNKLSKAIT